MRQLEVLRLAQLDDPQLRWARDVLGRQVGHMTHLVDDLTEVTRITRGRLELRRDYVVGDTRFTKWMASMIWRRRRQMRQMQGKRETNA